MNQTVRAKEHILDYHKQSALHAKSQQILILVLDKDPPGARYYNKYRKKFELMTSTMDCEIFIVLHTVQNL